MRGKRTSRAVRRVSGVQSFVAMQSGQAHLLVVLEEGEGIEALVA